MKEIIERIFNTDFQHGWIYSLNSAKHFSLQRWIGNEPGWELLIIFWLCVWALKVPTKTFAKFNHNQECQMIPSWKINIWDILNIWMPNYTKILLSLYKFEAEYFTVHRCKIYQPMQLGWGQSKTPCIMPEKKLIKSVRGWVG